MTTPVSTVFLRNCGEILLVRRSDRVQTYPGKWATVTGHIEASPERTAYRELHEETGLDAEAVTLVRAGEPFRVDDGGRQWLVHPFLFETDSRAVELNWEADCAEWVSPTAILDRETVPQLWTSYDRVRPTVEQIGEDSSHGSATLSVRALELLRDEAGLAARDADWAGLEAVARQLLAARPAMTAVTNRIHRVMAGADSPDGVHDAAHEGIARARRVDSEAAATAAEALGERVATLSRSGTVIEALARAAPRELLIAESRPGREGIGVAEQFADEMRVTLTTDAAFASELGRCETLLVGADSVLADGRVVNKVGTRAGALAATHDTVEVLVVTSTDKISPDTRWEPEERPPGELYDGECSISVANPTFDLTPVDAIDGILTERGRLDVTDIGAIAEEHRGFREWG